MVQRKTQLEWTELAVSVLEDRAKGAGLLGVDERLVYSPPRGSGAVPAKITVYTETAPSPTQHYWIPAFHVKETNRQVERIVDAQSRMLYAMDLKGRFNALIDTMD